MYVDDFIVDGWSIGAFSSELSFSDGDSSDDLCEAKQGMSRACGVLWQRLELSLSIVEIRKQMSGRASIRTSLLWITILQQRSGNF